jgi:hypothetical protein
MNVKRRGARVALCASTAAQRRMGVGRGRALARLRFNLSASWMQGKPRKTKEKSLHFLGFPWSNWDFPKGYSESK